MTLSEETTCLSQFISSVFLFHQRKHPVNQYKHLYGPVPQNVLTTNLAAGEPASVQGHI